MDGLRSATPHESGFCPRCDRNVRTVRPWPHWQKVRYGFFGVLALGALFSPIIMADGCMLVPLLLVFLSALGPLNGLAAEKPTCALCGGVATEPPRAAPAPVDAAPEAHRTAELAS